MLYIKVYKTYKEDTQKHSHRGRRGQPKIHSFPPVPRTHPIYKINKRQRTYFYVHAMPRQESAKERAFQCLNQMLLTVEHSLVSLFPNCPKHAKGSQSSNFLTFPPYKRNCATLKECPLLTKEGPMQCPTKRKEAA